MHDTGGDEAANKGLRQEDNPALSRIALWREGRLIGDQLFRSATAVGSNYRAACQGRSKAEFVAKLGVVVEEADESLFWLEILTELGIVPTSASSNLMKEAHQLVAILIASINTARTGVPMNRSGSKYSDPR